VPLGRRRVGELHGQPGLAGHRGGRSGRGAAAGVVTGGAAIRALVVANTRFWGSVAPVARVELARWRVAAEEIADEPLRELALAKLRDEAFNAEVAATLATIAPRPLRAAVVEAIVALEVLFDYLDGRTESLFDRREAGRASQSGAREGSDAEVALEEGRRLSASLGAVISGDPPEVAGPDGEYLNRLWRYAYERVATLPSYEAVLSGALGAAARCSEAQLRLHAAGAVGDGQLEQWAQEACEGSGLGWREYLAGSASSVLAMHALIATAARADVREADAQALDATYIAICAVITTLDSLVDDASDQREGEAGYIRLYDGRREIEQRLLILVEEALTRSQYLRDGAHHAMTLAGVAAYYTTHPGAADRENRAIRAAVRRRLAPAIWPAVAVLTTWRAAKRLRHALNADGPRQSPIMRPFIGDRRPRGG
jgi:tetraprenyl-beta-curcumene synthase